MSHALRHRMSMASDLGQTAIVAVLSITVVVSLLGMVLVNTVDQSFSLQQTKSVQIYANRALEAGENAYLTAINANPSLAQCSVSQNGSGTCGGLNYGQWNVVENSATSGADAEYYAFGNPQPTFDPTSNTLVSLSVQIVGAAHDASATNGYLFDQETLTVTPKNGFLKNVWWSNYESYSSTGNYSTCSYNWATQPTTYNIANQGADCSPVYFGPNDYLFGPVFTNDSVFVSGSGKTADSPSFGTPTSPSPVTTADPNCLFVDSTHGMTGSDSNCSSATGDVALFSPTTASDPSSSGNPVEQPPSTDAQLGTIANQNGCLYSGPTQIKLSTSNGVGQMTVISPDTPEETVAGLGYQFDENNLSDIATGAPINTNNCPNDGTAPLPSNGVVFVENATAAQSQAWANPFDDPLSNTVTNVTSTPSSPAANVSVTLTAKVTSASSQLNTGATVAFSQATCRNVNGSTCQSWNTAQTINNCSAAALSTPTAVTPATTPATYVSTATCTATESSKVGDTFSAAYSGGTYAKSSSANVGQTYTLTPSTTYGPDAQVTAGGCASCYYGETSSPDSEGDAFVSGSLSGQLTIGTANDVIVDGSITYADCSSTWTTGQSGFSAPSEGFCPYSPGGTNDSLGLIAYNYAEINRPLLASSTGNGNTPTVLSYCGSSPPPNCDPSNGTNGITIDAAILALTQSFVVNNYADGGTEGPLIVYGSVQQFARGPVGTFTENNNFGNITYTLSSGYQKNYTWDPLLDFVSPPSYLVPSTASWVLQSVTTNAGVGSASVCPPLLGAYSGLNAQGVPQTGPAVTQYCSQTTGGLPNYPTSTAPSPPTIGTATANANGTATLTWTDPVSNGGSAITNYTVSPSPHCSTCTGVTVTGATATSATVSGIVPGTSYTFAVTATNANGTSSPSSPSNSVVVPAAPGAPTNVSAAVNTNGSIAVNWTDPADDGSAITNYTVIPSPGCSSCAGTTVNGATATSATITGLTPGTAYSFTVTATNGIGTSPQSAASNTINAPTVPGAPTIGTATPGNASATVTWTAPGNTGGVPITGYVVTPYVGGTAKTAQTFSSTATSETVTGLTNGTAYTFKVAAINGVGTGAQSAASNAVTPDTPPGAPTIGTATRGNASATVTWTAPSNNGGSAITGYVVTPYIAGVAQTSQTFNSTATTETVTGLTNGTAYTFTVSAINIIGTSAQSAQSNSVTPATTPDAPTMGTAISANASVIVSWTAPAGNGGSAITGYAVTPYIGSSAQTVQTFNSTATTETVTGLTNGTAYTFTVAAINAIGTGAQSAASNSVTPATVPGAPTIGTATAGNASATVTWTAPGNNGGAAITGYVVTPYIGGAAQTAQTFNSTATTEVVTGLTNGTAYTFKVAAINAAGTGNQSGSSNSVTPTTVPGPPTGVNGISENSSALLSWTAPSSNGGTAITGYVVTPYIAGVAQTTQTFNSTATTQTVTGLSNGTAYTFTVAAVNADGTGTQSAPSASVTPATLPGAPTIGTVTPGVGSATVSWTAPASNGGSAITGYVVTPYKAGVAQTAQTFNSTATSETATGLANNTAYTFTVAAINGVGTGAASAQSNSVTTPTTPGAPTIGTATYGNVSATVTWTAPASNGGAAITGYVVTPYKAGVAQTAQTFNSTATSETATGLTNGSSYTFTVAAINGVGTGAASAQSNAVTPATVPGAPTIGTATYGNTTASVGWTAPASNGGQPVTGYVVTPYIAGVAQTAQTFNSTATTETATGLTNGTAYTFTVAATNLVGTGGQSGQSNSVTPATTPGAPTIGTATAGNASATVTWTAPASNGGQPVTGYVITPYKAGVAQATQTFNNPATSETATGLTVGSSYTFAVAAINLVGPGAASAQSNSITAVAVPGAPTIGTATYGNASASVAWTAPASNGGQPITGYVVTPYIAGVAQTTQTFNSTATTETATGLTNGTAYTFTVAAINSVGTGAQSGQSNSVTPATTPGAPTIGTATYGNASASVSWTAPASNGGQPVTGYVVTPYIAGVAQATQTFNNTATTETATGLTNGTAYTFTVAAINSVGIGAQSGQSNSVTPATTPGAPTIGTATYGNASASLTWTAPASNGGQPVTGYVVTPYIAGVAQATQTFNNTATTETATGLTNGTAYTFKVAAINSVGTGTQSAASNSVTPATTPGAPTIGTAIPGNTAVTVSWTAPASNGGQPITGYVVTPYIAGVAQATQTFNSTATTEAAVGLTNGTAYTFTVAAINVVGTGSQSGQSGSATPATVPGAPTIGTATYGNASATVSWAAPAANGGSAVTGYVVTPYKAGVAQATQTFNNTATTETATGLTNGSSYTFTVAAINVMGTGAASAQSNAVTPATTPGAPTIGTATYGNTTASVAWTAPASNGGQPVTGYVVTPYIAGVAQATQTFNNTTTTETATGLTNGTAYTFTVAAINLVGTGAASAQSNSVTPATTPGAPTIGTATAGAGSATVTWTAPASNGGQPVTGYVVTPYKAGVAQTAQTFNNTATTETATGLANNTAYTFTVAAINSVGTGAASAQSNSVTTATTPGAPTIGTATKLTNSTVSVSWTAPASNGGSAVTGYVVTPYIGGTAQTAQTFNTTATTDTVTGLSNFSTYTFKVAAINAVGTGSQSAASNSTAG